MTTVKDLNPFEKSLEKLAETVFHSKRDSNLYSVKKINNYTSTTTYNTKFNDLDVSIDVFSTAYLVGYKLEVKENNKLIGSLKIDQGDPNENWGGEKTLFYSLANVSINNDEKVKKDLISIYLKDAVKHMQKELNEKLKATTPTDYERVLNNMKKLKEAKKEDHLTSSSKHTI